MGTRAERAIAIVKDLTLFIGGLSGIAYQQLTGNVNFVFLGIFTAMIGIPGLTNLTSLLHGSITKSSSPPQALPVSEPESGKSPLS